VNKLISLVAALALSGCWFYGDPVYDWKPGVTEADMQKDSDECLRGDRAERARGSPGGYYSECMHSRGYMTVLGTKPDYAK